MRSFYPSTVRQLVAALSLSISTLFTLAGCSKTQATSPAATAAPPSVSVAKPVSRSIIDFDEFTGRVAAMESVEVRARVTGHLVKVHFKEGQIVRPGDVLFTIDPDPYSVEVDRRSAELKRAESALALSRGNEARGERLIRNSAISREEYETLVKTRDEADASAGAARALLAAAKLDLGYTTIRAPIGGRTGRALVTAGNLVNGAGANATLLTTVVSLDPVYVLFDADERAYLRYQQPQETRINGGARNDPKPVHLALADEKTFSRVGRMDFVDNQLDTTTGTIRVRAVFQNKTGRELTPGMFARVRVEREESYEAVLVQDQAIATDLGRRVVMTVDSQGVVRPKSVELGPLHEGLRVVRTGLGLEDWVIVDGLQRAQPNAKVTPQQVAMQTSGRTASPSR